MNQVQKIKDNIDPTIFWSTIAASAAIGVAVILARKAGLGTVAQVVKGG